MLYLGIDQHRKQLTVCVRNEEGDVTLGRQVSTEWRRVRGFLARIREEAGEGGFVVILEVCGFNDWLVKLLAEYACREVILVQPEKRSQKKTARFILGQLVRHVLRCDRRMKSWYQRIKKRRGSKIGRVAVMRRLATIIWHMVKYEEPYMIGGPPSGSVGSAS